MKQIPSDLSTLSATDIDTIANERGEQFAKGQPRQRGGRNEFVVKTNQIRNVFGHIVTLRTEFKQEKKWTENLERELILLKPKLAYAAGRERDVKQFQQFMFRIIDGVIQADESNKDKALGNFFEIVEAVVAYHKFYGGRDK
jgi:CRISPR-associated protein Csm2